jgi:hypothetical protein
MNAVTCDWGGDLSVGPTGDIGAAPAVVEIQQRLIRRLLTNQGAYVWHIDYGAGLGSFVGQPLSADLIQSTVLNQIQNEQLIGMSPSPTIQIDQGSIESLSTASITIQYQIIGSTTAISVVVQPSI